MADLYLKDARSIYQKEKARTVRNLWKAAKWGKSSNSVYSVLKKYGQRVERFGRINKKYERVWGKMEVRWEKKSILS
jgi:hypothetical protein